MDEYDDISFRPNFVVPIYSGDRPDELDLSEGGPPFFMVITHDDRRPGEMAGMYIALEKLEFPSDCTFTGKGHGYGLRRTELSVTRWPDRMEDWMGRKGFPER